MLLGMLDTLGIKRVLVTPQNWKKVVFRDYDKDDYGINGQKQMAIDHVQYHWPDVELVPGKCRVKQDGIAEAVCICEYGCYQEGVLE